ncbi:MAG: hypothetical protein FJ109_19220, partial [Deltaproteobacteria bacterium]|nr:hypothetical protein [Deltaproteobacteria bacterium]
MTRCVPFVVLVVACGCGNAGGSLPADAAADWGTDGGDLRSDEPQAEVPLPDAAGDLVVLPDLVAAEAVEPETLRMPDTEAADAPADALDGGELVDSGDGQAEALTDVAPPDTQPS